MTHVGVGRVAIPRGSSWGRGRDRRGSHGIYRTVPQNALTPIGEGAPECRSGSCREAGGRGHPGAISASDYGTLPGRRRRGHERPAVAPPSARRGALWTFASACRSTGRQRRRAEQRHRQPSEATRAVRRPAVAMTLACCFRSCSPEGSSDRSVPLSIPSSTAL
jgi:hypothetical protein